MRSDLSTLERGTSAMEAIVVAVDALARAAARSRYATRRLTASWLARTASDHTRRAYFADLADVLAWCDRHGLDPLAARPADYDIYKADLGTGYAPATVGRKLSAVSSWYGYPAA